MKDYSKCEIEFAFEYVFPYGSHEEIAPKYVYWRIKPSELTLWDRWFHNPWRQFERVIFKDLNPVYTPKAFKQELSHIKTYEQAMNYQIEQDNRARYVCVRETPKTNRGGRNLA